MRVVAATAACLSTVLPVTHEAILLLRSHPGTEIAVYLHLYCVDDTLSNALGGLLVNGKQVVASSKQRLQNPAPPRCTSVPLQPWCHAHTWGGEPQLINAKHAHSIANLSIEP